MDVYANWIALHDCVEVGREKFRFSEDQLRYHYTKDRGVLDKLYKKLPNSM